MNAPTHDHDHGHGTVTATATPPRRTGRIFFAAVVLNLAFVAIEVGAGLYANSLAAARDAGQTSAT